MALPILPLISYTAVNSPEEIIARIVESKPSINLRFKIPPMLIVFGI